MRKIIAAMKQTSPKKS